MSRSPAKKKKNRQSPSSSKVGKKYMHNLNECVIILHPEGESLDTEKDRVEHPEIPISDS